MASWLDWERSDDGFPERLVEQVFLSMLSQAPAELIEYIVSHRFGAILIINVIKPFVSKFLPYLFSQVAAGTNYTHFSVRLSIF